jgi:hypothetical protein
MTHDDLMQVQTALQQALHQMTGLTEAVLGSVFSDPDAPLLDDADTLARVLEALLPIERAYQHWMATSVQAAPPTPWPPGTVVRVWDSFGRQVRYGVVGTMTDQTVQVCGVDTIQPYACADVTWVAAPTPMTTALLPAAI